MPDGGWQDDRVDCNWLWDSEEAGPISDICAEKVVVGEKIFMIDTVDGLLNAVFWYNCKRLDFVEATNSFLSFFGHS